ncbi:hypothetical protein [Desulfosporosinus sp. FKA]
MYNGSKKALFASFIDNDLTEDELEMLKKLIEKR